MSKIKNDGLDQYGAEPFEKQQLETAGVEGVNVLQLILNALHVQFTYNEAVSAIHDIQYRPRAVLATGDGWITPL